MINTPHAFQEVLNADRIIAILTLLAAVAGAYFAWRAPDKKDVRRVEEHVSHLEGMKTGIARMDTRMQRQEDAEALDARIRQVSITVNGDALVGEPLRLHLFGGDDAVRFTRVELLSEAGNLFGSIECEISGSDSPRMFVAMVPVPNLQKWFSAGTALEMVRRRLLLRVWMVLGSESPQVYRDMAVYLFNDSAVVTTGANRQVRMSLLRIEGSV